MSITTKMPLNWYSSMKNFFRKIRIIFDIENWLWKSEIRIFQSPPAKRTLICQNFFFFEKVPFSIQLSYHLMRKLLKKSWMVSNRYLLLNIWKTDLLLFKNSFSIKRNVPYSLNYDIARFWLFLLCLQFHYNSRLFLSRTFLAN